VEEVEMGTGSLDLDLGMRTSSLQNDGLIPNAESHQAPTHTFITLAGLLGIPLLEFHVYVSDTPPPNFPTFSGTATAITEALFVGVATGTVVLGWIEIR
jgi:hypothetical protein